MTPRCNHLPCKYVTSFQLTDVQHLILNSMVLKEFQMEWLLILKENCGLLLLEAVR